MPGVNGGTHSMMTSEHAAAVIRERSSVMEIPYGVARIPTPSPRPPPKAAAQRRGSARRAFHPPSGQSDTSQKTPQLAASATAIAANDRWTQLPTADSTAPMAN